LCATRGHTQESRAEETDHVPNINKTEINIKRFRAEPKHPHPGTIKNHVSTINQRKRERVLFAATLSHTHPTDIAGSQREENGKNRKNTSLKVQETTKKHNQQQKQQKTTQIPDENAKSFDFLPYLRHQQKINLMIS
jgi:hypothetical protein